MITIKVLGPGCANCKALESIARQAVAALAIEAQVVKVESYAEIMNYPILSTPGLMINERLVVSGRVPSLEQVTSWLADAAMQEA